MAIIRQTSLFSIQDLYDMEPTDRYDAIISVIDLHRIYTKVGKTPYLGTPEELNVPATIISYFNHFQV